MVPDVIAKEKRISLVELETILKTHPDVNDCYCFKYGDVLACAVATNNVELSDKELKKYLAEYFIFYYFNALDCHKNQRFFRNDI